MPTWPWRTRRRRRRACRRSRSWTQGMRACGSTSRHCWAPSLLPWVRLGAAVGFGHRGTPAAQPGDAASAGAGSSGVLEQGASRGASLAGRAHPGWNRSWVLPVHPTRAETPAFPADRVPVPGDPSCLGYGITAAVSIGTATGNREIHGDDGEERTAGAGGEGHRGNTAASAQTVLPMAPTAAPQAGAALHWGSLGCSTG